MTRTGRKFWALDYKEWVTVLRVERRGTSTGRYSTFTVQRENGEITKNYPAYLLKVSP
jgi:hypothetical protein